MLPGSITPKGALVTGFGLGFALVLAGCTVGPNYRTPQPPDATGYTPAPLTKTSGATNLPDGNVQDFVTVTNIPGEWWELFHSVALSRLIERSLTNNPDLQSAQAALAVARENVFIGQGAFYPAINAGFSATRDRTSQAISPVPNSGALNYSLFTPQVSVSYVPDVFGLNRRTVESLQAQREQARFALAATHITLSANIASAAVQEASLRAQIDATRELVRINTDLLEILRRQLAQGYARRLDVAAQESQLAQTQATLPPLRKQLAQERDVLTALAGDLPNQELPEMFALPDLRLPDALPVSLPAKLVEQRPDIRQAGANLHVAAAQIGVAVANRLPNLTLTADAGTMALTAGKIFAGGSGFWDVGASLTQPVFEGRQLFHKEQAARAAYAQAAAQYRSTVVVAFQNVADTLHALQQDADALKAAAEAEQAAGITLRLARNQYQSGYAGYLAVLSAEQACQQAVLSVIQARANRYLDTIALFQALGGGWWNRSDLPPG